MAKTKKTEPKLGGIEITSATIKDDLCDYKYSIVNGVGLENVHSVNGKNIIMPDLGNAMAALRVHLAIIDKAFSLSGIEVQDVNDVRGHELVADYVVTGIKVKGTSEDLKVIIIGNKHVDVSHGRSDITTPQIPLNATSSYPHFEALLEAVQNVQKEVELYHNGKYVLPEEGGEDENQLTLADALNESHGPDFDNQFQKSAK